MSTPVTATPPPAGTSFADAAPAAPGRWTRLVTQYGVFGLIGLYVAGRVVVLAGGTVFTSWDTFSYAYRGDPFFDRGELVSFTGAAPRLWGVPLFYSLFDSDFARVVGQWVIGTVAWSLLAWVVWTLGRHLAAKIVGAGAVLMLALLNQVGNLDFAILAESLGISLGVLTLALLLRWITTGSRVALGLMTATAFWWTFTRPDIRVFTVFLILALAVFAWRSPPRRVAAVAAGGVLAAAVVWCSMITPVSTTHFERWAATEAPQEQEIFFRRLRVDVLPRPEIREFFVQELGMPSCPGAEASAARPEWDLVEFANEYRACPELVAWGEENIDDAFTRLALEAPGPYLRMSLDLTAWSLTGGTYAHVPTVIPGLVHRVVFPGLPWTMPVTFGGLALLLAAALATRAGRRDTVRLWTAITTAAVCTVSVLASVVVIGGFWRFGIQETVGLRIAMILLVVVALDGALVWWGSRRPVTRDV